jgi:hypothetical protein
MNESAVDMPQTHLHNTADLVELIPYVLGFQPVESVVVAEFLLRRERLGAVIRIDSPMSSDAGAVGQMLAHHVGRSGADGAVVVIYGSADAPPDVQYGASVARDIGIALQSVGVRLCDAAWVGGGRWRSYLCWDDGCCPIDGYPIAHGPISSAAIIAGMAPLPDRQALVGSLQPVTHAAMMRALSKAIAASAVAGSRPHAPAIWLAGTKERFRRALVRARAQGRDGQRPAVLTDDEVARLLVGLQDADARDACWQLLEVRPSSQTLAVCWQLARRSVPPFRAAPLFLLAWTAWRCGDGALARVAAEQALREDGEYSAAILLMEMLDHGIRPGEIPRLIRPLARSSHPWRRS